MSESLRGHQKISCQSISPNRLVFDKPFLLNVKAMDYGFGALLVQANEKGHEQAIYNFNRTMVTVEQRYNHMESKCLAL